MVYNSTNIHTPQSKWHGTHKLELYGRALLEDSGEYFDPLIEKLKRIADMGNDFELSIKFEYFNTAATQYITRLFYTLEPLSNIANVKIIWHYIECDEDMHEAGLTYQETTSIPITLIPYD